MHIYRVDSPCPVDTVRGERTLRRECGSAKTRVALGKPVTRLGNRAVRIHRKVERNSWKQRSPYLKTTRFTSLTPFVVKHLANGLRSFAVSLPGSQCNHPIFFEELLTTPTFAGNFTRMARRPDAPSLSTNACYISAVAVN